MGGAKEKKKMEMESRERNKRERGEINFHSLSGLIDANTLVVVVNLNVECFYVRNRGERGILGQGYFETVDFSTIYCFATVIIF